MQINELLKRKFPTYAGRITRIWNDATDCDFVNANVTTTNLVMFANELKQNVSDNSAKTYLAYVKACVNILKADGELEKLSAGWEKSANIKREQVAMCYLTEDEIELLADYSPRTDNERKARAQFLVECYTGARSSDVVRLTKDNIDNEGNVVYVSQKTKIRTIVPCKPLVRDILESGDNVENTGNTMPPKTKNDIIRRMLKNAGVDDVVKVYKGGKEFTGEKYKFCSTHTGRRSFASNLYLRGVDLYSISKLMGHASPDQTAGYVVCGLRKLPQEALNYFK